jgi:hypothetical protein
MTRRRQPRTARGPSSASSSPLGLAVVREPGGALQRCAVPEHKRLTVGACLSVHVEDAFAPSVVITGVAIARDNALEPLALRLASPRSRYRDRLVHLDVILGCHAHLPSRRSTVWAWLPQFDCQALGLVQDASTFAAGHRRWNGWRRRITGFRPDLLPHLPLPGIVMISTEQPDLVGAAIAVDDLDPMGRGL